MEKHRPTLWSRLCGRPTCGRCRHATPCPAVLRTQPIAIVDRLPRPEFEARMRQAMAEWRSNTAKRRYP